MKPNRTRSLFEQYGEVTRLFLAEEDANKRRMRKMNGGNGSKQFTEGWVEFSDKKTAKEVAESLNGKSIGATKGDYYHDDVWNLKYLSNFKWEYLTEKLAYERRVRENKLKLAFSQVIVYNIGLNIFCNSL
jgi:ESF2/ABP1 family protein